MLIFLAEAADAAPGQETHCKCSKRGRDRVAPFEQPGKLLGGRAEHRQPRRAEQPRVFRMSDIQGGQSATPPTAPRSSSGTGTATGTASGTAGAGQADATRGYVPRPAPGYDDVRYESQGPSGFSLGMTLVAAVLMMIGGLFDFFEGLAALLRGNFFVVLPNRPGPGAGPGSLENP